MIATITPMEALRRLIAEVKQLDAVEVGARWNQLQGELGVAEGVVRDYVEPKPVGHINHYSGGSVGVSGQSMLALPHGAPLYAAPVAAKPSEASQPIGWIAPRLIESLANYRESAQVPSNFSVAVQAGQRYQEDLPIYAAPTAAVSAAPSGEVWHPIETAPKGKNGISFMMLAYGPEGDQTVSIGIHIDGSFYAGGIFYCIGKKEKPFEIREHKVQPTHWMEIPGAPTITSTKGSK